MDKEWPDWANPWADILICVLCRARHCFLCSDGLLQQHHCPIALCYIHLLTPGRPLLTSGQCMQAAHTLLYSVFLCVVATWC